MKARSYIATEMLNYENVQPQDNNPCNKLARLQNRLKLPQQLPPSTPRQPSPNTPFLF